MHVQQRTLRPPRRIPVKATRGQPSLTRPLAAALRRMVRVPPFFMRESAPLPGVVRVSRRSAAREQAVRAVRRALERGAGSWLARRGWRGGDLLLTFLFATLLLSSSFTTLALSLAAGAQAATASERTPLALELQQTVSEAHIQTFLSLLSRLPSVRAVQYLTREQQFERLGREHPEQAPFLATFIPENPLPDRAVVTLWSLRDAPSFRELLERPALQSVLAPDFPWTFAAWEDEVRSDMVWLRSLQRVLSTVAGVALLCVVLVLFQAVRTRQRAFAQEHRVYLLLGAASWSRRKVLLQELGALTFLAVISAAVLSWGAVHVLSPSFLV